MGRNTRRLLTAALVILGAGVAGAQSTPNMATPSTGSGTSSSSTPATTTTPPVEQIVALARTVEPGTPTVTAFTVPAAHQLVVTDVIITNPGTTPLCGAAISPSGTATSTVTGSATTVTGGTTTGATRAATPVAATTTALESGTGTLCIPAQTSLTLSLTTGLEFAAGQSVVLANQPPATTTTSTTTSNASATATNGPLLYHLRGFLVAAGV